VRIFEHVQRRWALNYSLAPRLKAALAAHAKLGLSRRLRGEARRMAEAALAACADCTEARAGLIHSIL
jgi:hypothetical protein